MDSEGVRAHPPRHRGRTLFLLLLAALLGVPGFFGLYTALDLLGLVGALAFILVLGLILLVAWLVHVSRTFAPEIRTFIRSFVQRIVRAVRDQPPLMRFGRRLHPAARFVRRRIDT